MALIVSDEDGNEIVEQRGYEDEAEMQEYIEKNPEAIPLYQINDELEISIAAREFNVDGEFIDAVAFDQNGGVYILETKLASNGEKRKVIAQAFDYGAALWDNQHPNQFINNLDSSVENYESFQDWSEEELGLTEEEYEEFKENVFENLEDGSFSYVIVMDEISDRLKTLIKYLMANSMFDLYGVELESYEHNGNTIVVPNLHGTEVKKNTRTTKSSSRNAYTDRKKLWDKMQKEFDELVEEDVSYNNASRFRQIRFPGVPNSIHLEWIYSSDTETLNIRIDFERSKAAETNKELIESIEENRFSEIKDKTGIEEIEVDMKRVKGKIKMPLDITLEELKEDEELQEQIVEKTYQIYEIVKDDIRAEFR